MIMRWLPGIILLMTWSSAVSQLTNNYYFAENSTAIIDTLENVAIIPGWVQLEPNIYTSIPEKLKAAEEEASLFFQDLLYSSLLLTNSPKLRDIYRVNSLLLARNLEFPRISLGHSPGELCELLNVDAVLLSFISYNKTFVLNNREFLNLFKQVEWNKPLKRKNVVIALFYKDGTPLWAAAFDTGGVNSTVREENQVFPVTLYGYFGKK